MNQKQVINKYAKMGSNGSLGEKKKDQMFLLFFFFSEETFWLEKKLLAVRGKRKALFIYFSGLSRSQD